MGVEGERRPVDALVRAVAQGPLDTGEGEPGPGGAAAEAALVGLLPAEHDVVVGVGVGLRRRGEPEHEPDVVVVVGGLHLEGPGDGGVEHRLGADEEERRPVVLLDDLKAVGADLPVPAGPQRRPAAQVEVDGALPGGRQGEAGGKHGGGDDLFHDAAFIAANVV